MTKAGLACQDLVSGSGRVVGQREVMADRGDRRAGAGRSLTCLRRVLAGVDKHLALRIELHRSSC